MFVLLSIDVTTKGHNCEQPIRVRNYGNSTITVASDDGRTYSPTDRTSTLLRIGMRECRSATMLLIPNERVSLSKSGLRVALYQIYTAEVVLLL